MHSQGSSRQKKSCLANSEMVPVGVSRRRAALFDLRSCNSFHESSAQLIQLVNLTMPLLSRHVLPEDTLPRTNRTSVPIPTPLRIQTRIPLCMSSPFAFRPGAH